MSANGTTASLRTGVRVPLAGRDTPAYSNGTATGTRVEHERDNRAGQIAATSNGTTERLTRCAVCGIVRPLDEMLRTHPRTGPGRTHYVCRPSLDPRCFAAVPSRAEVRIAPASAETAGGPP